MRLTSALALATLATCAFCQSVTADEAAHTQVHRVTSKSKHAVAKPHAASVKEAHHPQAKHSNLRSPSTVSFKDVLKSKVVAKHDSPSKDHKQPKDGDKGGEKHDEKLPCPKKGDNKHPPKPSHDTKPPALKPAGSGDDDDDSKDDEGGEDEGDDDDEGEDEDSNDEGSKDADDSADLADPEDPKTKEPKTDNPKPDGSQDDDGEKTEDGSQDGDSDEPVDGSQEDDGGSEEKHVSPEKPHHHVTKHVARKVPKAHESKKVHETKKTLVAKKAHGTKKTPGMKEGTAAKKIHDSKKVAVAKKGHKTKKSDVKKVHASKAKKSPEMKKAHVAKKTHKTKKRASNKKTYHLHIEMSARSVKRRGRGAGDECARKSVRRVGCARFLRIWLAFLLLRQLTQSPIRRATDTSAIHTPAMKLSTAALALTAVSVLLVHAEPAQSSTLARTQRSRDHIPLQVKVRSDMRGWRAPVVDKTPQKLSAEQQRIPFAKHSKHRSSRAKKDAVKHTRNDDDDSVEASSEAANTEDNRQRARVSIKSGEKSADRVKPNPPSLQKRQHLRDPQKESTEGDNEHSQKENENVDDADPSTELQQQTGETPQDDGTGDLYEVAPGGMTNHQYYNVSQVEAEVRKVSAAVKLQMAKTAPLEGDASNSLIFIVAVAGLVVGVIGIIVAVVALLRQYSEFPEVELESDLPSHLEDGIPQATAAAQSATEEGAVDTSELSSYIPSDVEEEETKEGDEDDANGALEHTRASV